MDRFARMIVGYHGCRKRFADQILMGELPIEAWEMSQNDYDWLGEGIYFWEHSPDRARRWAEEQHGQDAAVLGCILNLGECFDLLDEQISLLLAESFVRFQEFYATSQRPLPQNRGAGKKLRHLDCAVINTCLTGLIEQGIKFDSVRGAFLEGESLFPGTSLSAETHIQIAVRNVDCILGTFRPKLT